MAAGLPEAAGPGQGSAQHSCHGLLCVVPTLPDVAAPARDQQQAQNRVPRHRAARGGHLSGTVSRQDREPFQVTRETVPSRGRTYTLLSVRERVSASLDRLCCSLSLALVTGATA